MLARGACMGGSVDRPRVVGAVLDILGPAVFGSGSCVWPLFSSEMVQVASGELRLKSTDAAAMVGELGVGGTAAAAAACEAELGCMGEVAGAGETDLGRTAATKMAGETGFRGMGAGVVLGEIEGTGAAAVAVEERTLELWEWLVVPVLSTS